MSLEIERKRYLETDREREGERLPAYTARRMRFGAGKEELQSVEKPLFFRSNERQEGSFFQTEVIRH